MSLFSRPAWAKSHTTDLEEPEVNIFSHSNRSYGEIVAEQERKKQEKLGKKKAKEERRNSGKRDSKGEPSHESSYKKRRITFEDGEALLGSIGLKPTSASRTEVDDDAEDADERPVRRSPRTSKQVNQVSTRRSRRRAEVVDLGSSDNEAEQIAYEAPKHDAVEAVEIEDESDDEFAELARRARLERQRKDLDAASQIPGVGVSSSGAGVGVADAGQHQLPTPPLDPVVQLFISSPMPNTNPLIVHRKLSQRIQEIRVIWCKKQGFSDEMTKTIFFTHRLRKVYDATTCRSLGLDVDAFGNIVMKGAEGKEGVERVHLQAVTEESFQELKAEQAKKEALRQSGELPLEDSATTGAADDAGEMQKSEDMIIRLTLKARGRNDFKLKVKPNTTCSKIIGAYRKCQHLEDTQTVFLEFDGDRLDPDDEVQNTELSDLDCLHVHIS